MKTRLKRRFVLLLVSLLGLLMIPPSASADDIPELLSGPVNPEFLQYITDLEAGEINANSAEGYSRGYIPEPLARVETPEEDLNLAATLPASYDLRQTGRVTEIRNQGQLGVCWTFASLGSLESYLKPTKTEDLSENNIRWNHGFDSGPTSGGNASMALAYFSRWSGPVGESSDPYGSSQKTGLAPLYHIQKAEFIAKSPAMIKTAILNGGAVYSSIYSDAIDSPTYYNKNTHALYYDGNAGTDHAVVIVGWDDNFDRNRFSKTPPNNGAWIIRNSWGSDWGDRGYFYLSYYDTYAGNEVTAFHNAEATNNYNRIYQYDPFGNTGSRGYATSDRSSWGANIFTAVANENLMAISTYSLSTNTTAEIKIYTNVSADNPSSGQLSATQTVTFPNRGYYTVKLNSPVNLTASQRFAVVIKYTTPQNAYPIPVERAMANYCSGVTAKAGESFVSFEGTGNWRDISANDRENVCIKAFTGGTSVATLTGIKITSPATKLTYQLGEPLDLSGLVVTGSYSDGSSRKETVTAANISGFNSATAGSKTLTISIGGKTTSYTITVKSAVSSGVDVYYRTHIQNVGWQYDCKNGQVSGTSGYGYRLEAIQMQLIQTGYDLGIAYRTHIQNIGWAPWRYDKEISGTSGMGLRLEAIEIQLVGNDAQLFDVYYRVHCQNIGWMGWAKNGLMAGTSGYGYRLEAIQIEVVPKGTYANSYSDDGAAYLEMN
ncbi:lectin like domain-containing protein [uncultured Acetobacterium sp.]|uniref:lectin like domain-containing protein n=1 Tax=uncultured Acetobacterium sp. TaxID=217139 RepID=UPI0025CDA7AE|nr:lectin like domain-containing protein [uncultured Acetobacterium sp.]